jgi:hypothetical protein
MEYWSVGVLGEWSVGVLGEWSDGKSKIDFKKQGN